MVARRGTLPLSRSHAKLLRAIAGRMAGRLAFFASTTT
jgi:hypothetical protein